MSRIGLVAIFALTTMSLLVSQTPDSASIRGAVGARSKAGDVHLYGAGSPMHHKLFSSWSDAYSHLHPDRKVDFQEVGHRTSTKALIEKKISFAVTNRMITGEEYVSKGDQLLQLPVALHAVVPVYNLANVSGLRLSGNTLAEIFLGAITSWDDPAIARDNPGVGFPKMPIKVAHHFPSDGQIDTQLMADYLSFVSPRFRSAISHSSNWPLPNASARYVKGAGMMGFIEETAGSIGYAEFEAVRHSSLSFAAVTNSEGEFVIPSSETLAASAVSAIQSSAVGVNGFGGGILNAPGKKSYPITSFYWLLFHRYAENSEEQEQIAIVSDFLKWILTDGQNVATTLGYPALPEEIVNSELRYLESSKMRLDEPIVSP